MHDNSSCCAAVALFPLLVISISEQLKQTYPLFKARPSVSTFSRKLSCTIFINAQLRTANDMFYIGNVFRWEDVSEAEVVSRHVGRFDIEWAVLEVFEGCVEDNEKVVRCS